METFNPNDIAELCNKWQYKYCELVSSSKKYGGYNQTPKDLKTKLTSIKKYLQELPNDIYFLNCKISPKGDIFTYKYNKGNLSENTTPVVYPVINNAAPLEKFQTLEEWKKQELTINSLRNELELLKMQNQIKESLQEPEQEEKENKILGCAENILPQFMPVLDRYFNIKEKELEIKSKALDKKPAPVPAKKIIKKFRPLPETTGENLQAYFNYFINLTDSQAADELTYVSTQKPDLYNLLITKFYEDESN
jgi:hypothetical protein